MGQIAIYKVLTAGKRRRYPVIVRNGVIGKVDHKECQAQFCGEKATFFRVWLSPDVLGEFTTFSLNGVRYCDSHATAIAQTSRLPLIRTGAELHKYHGEVLDHEAHFGGDDPAVTWDPKRTVRGVGPHGSILFRVDGTMGCESLDGSRILTCCLVDAQHQIGLTSRRDRVLHGPGCPVGRDIEQTREMAAYKPLNSSNVRAFLRS